MNTNGFDWASLLQCALLLCVLSLVVYVLSLYPVNAL